MNEADDGDAEMLELLIQLGPQLKEAWDKRSKEYNAELTASLRPPEAAVPEAQPQDTTKRNRLLFRAANRSDKHFFPY